jgi:acyl dehydratase
MTPAITDTISWWAPFEALEPGQEFTTRGRTVTEADVVGFASLSGDWHPQHCDAAWAEGSPFGERIAHGMLVIALASGLVPFDPGRVIALRRVADATFKRPVRFGDTLRVEGRIADLGSGSEEAGLVTFAWNVVNQDDQTVCRARVEVLWKRDALAEPEPERNADFVPIPL